MNVRVLLVLAVLLIASLGSLPVGDRADASVDPLLRQLVDERPLEQTAVVITYGHAPTAADLDRLRAIGVMGGTVLDHLPMVLTTVNRQQLTSLAREPGVVSLYANHVMEPYTNASRTFIGATALREDAEVTGVNGGVPVTGEGVGVAVIDTGIDATHPDLQLGDTVVQNVYFPLVDLATTPNCPAVAASIVGFDAPGTVLELGFAGPVYAEDQPQTDIEGGHGTFVGGVVAGSGEASDGFYGGVAPGAHLVGIMAGNDCGLPLFGILQSFEYVLEHQETYNIRVVNNSWGSRLANVPYDKDSPINVATRALHDTMITVVFAAGNAGDVPGAINPHCVAAWVICVAASLKQGLGDPAPFSSRGEDDGTGTDVAGMPADPDAPPNLRPDLTAPGVDIKSARNKGPGLTNLAGSIPLFVGSNDLQTIPPAFLPFYTTSRGTSFSAPHVAGVVALMMEANPDLTPGEVVTILRETANPMPYEERVVGAGYLDAHNAVRVALELARVGNPFNLIPGPDTPEIFDPAGDQLGTAAQDIIQGTFTYDADTDELVYRLTLADLSNTTTHMRWTMASDFGDMSIFVHANVTETGDRTFGYGSIAPDPDTGVNTQTNIGSTDSGEFDGNDIVWRLAIDRINEAVGFDVRGTTSTNTVANAWLLVGTTLTGGLLLNADSASGRDYEVSDTTPPPPPPTIDAFCERLPGAVAAGQTGEVALELQLPDLDARLTFRPGNQDVTFGLVDDGGELVASGDGPRGTQISESGLEAGAYHYRIDNDGDRDIDVVVRSCQSDG